MYSKMQGRGATGGNGLSECAPSSSKMTNLAVLHVAHIVRADDVERAGLGREDRAAVEFAEHQRADAERVARADQLLVGQGDERIGAFDLAQRLDEAVDEAVARRARQQMQDHLGVGGRLHDGAIAHQLAAQRQAVGEIAVMADREAAGIEFGEQRLDVAQHRLAGGRIAHMADRDGAGQPIDDLAAREGVADEAEPALGMEPVAVEGDDAGRLLAAMLQRVQAERRDGGRIGMSVDAEYAAFFAQPVAVEIAEGRVPVMVIGCQSISMHAFALGFEQLLHPAPARAIVTRISAIRRQVCRVRCAGPTGPSGVSVSLRRGRSRFFKMVFPGLPATST